AGFDPHVVPDTPTQYGQPLQERSEAGLPYRIVGKRRQDHADATYPLALLRGRPDRPCYRAAQQRDGLPPLHSITSSAVAMSVGGTAMPSILAVWALMTSSNLLDCTTGRSAGFAPLRMRPAYTPSSRNASTRLAP